MSLVVDDACVDIDTLIGPLPDFTLSFDKFFIGKAASLLNEKSKDMPVQKVVLCDSTDLRWMHQITLASNQQQQNLEIIYNNNDVYFKTTRILFRDDELFAFPSKDLEIALGLQFVPLNKHNNYPCKKCPMTFSHQNHLMLHLRYFCQTVDSPVKRRLDSSDASGSQVRQPYDHISPSYPNLKGNYIMSYLQSLINCSTATSYHTNLGMNSILMEAIQKKAMAYQIPDMNQLNGFVMASSSQIDMNRSQVKNVEPHCQSVNYRESKGNKINSGQDTTAERPGFRRPPAQMESKSVVAGVLKNTRKSTDSNRVLSAPALQNWCAKCNTQFRLTSDLVYHMRTLHRKDEIPQDKKLVNLPRFGEQVVESEAVDLSKASGQSASKSKYLKCHICLEVFKEKHHLSRHMTSHR